MNNMNTVIVIMLIILVTCFFIGWYMAGYSMGIIRQSLPDARKWQEEHYDLSWYDPIEKTDYTVESWDDYILHVQFIPCSVQSDRYVIISHGYTDNRFGALKYAKNYLDLGFHVLVYDLRGHGENEKTFCTYSVRESRDLDALIRDSRARYPDARVFGLHGESLGGATTIACLQYNPPVDFAVSDCGFSEIKSVLRAGLRSMHLPGCFVGLASVCAKLLYGYRYGQMRPIDSLPGTKLPILFFHGAADDFILPFHSEAMHKAAADHSELCLIPGAGHAASVLTDPAEYRRRLEAFLQNRVFP